VSSARIVAAMCAVLSSVCTTTVDNSLAIPSWESAVSTNQRAVTPCGWGVKAGMVRVWVAGKTV